MLSFDKSIAGPYLKEYADLFEAIPDIKNIYHKIISSLGDDFINKGNGIYIHKDARVSDLAYLEANIIIDKEAIIKPFAYLREYSIIGKKCHIGRSEVKNAIIFDETNLPHYNYAGDSILGSHVNMGAGSIITNVKLNKDVVINNKSYHKMGAIIGDNVKIGANAVINPGHIIKENTFIKPLSSVWYFSYYLV